MGEISVHQDNLNEFLALAEDLQLRGLTQSEAEPKTLENEEEERIVKSRNRSAAK